MGRRPRVRGALRQPTQKALPKAQISRCTCQSLHWPPKHEFPFGGSILTANMFVPAVIMLLSAFAKRCMRYLPSLTAPVVLMLCADKANAMLTYNIFESGSDVVVTANGSLNLPGSFTTVTPEIYGNGAIIPSDFSIAPGFIQTPAKFRQYGISGSPISFGSGGLAFADSSTGFRVVIRSGNKFRIIESYTGGQIASSSTFANKTLSSLGITSTGLIGTWTIDGSSETINVFIGRQVPAPLPLFGAAAAFSWSRKLRRRIGTSVITPPRA